MKLAYVFIPLAYNGPCISESGPRVFEYILKKNNYIGDFYRIDLQWNESPKKYVIRIYKTLKKLDKYYDKLVIFGGNHLSLLPVYLLANNKKYNSLTLDAHRDYLLNNGMITHGSFLRFIPKQNVERTIAGFRDEVSKEDLYDFFSEEISSKELKKRKCKIELKNINYLDIDVDVLDESVFPYTDCKKNNGLSLKELYNIFDNIGFKDIKILSLSEYAYVLDEQKEGLKILLDIVDKFVS